MGHVTSAKKTFRIQDKKGLHLRAAASFVDTANRFASSIAVYKGDAMFDGKSILSLLCVAATYGTILTISAQGADALEAVKALGSLIEPTMSAQPAVAADANRFLQVSAAGPMISSFSQY
jgi:phosphotransferase system HPr (HPr) family protein